MFINACSTFAEMIDSNQNYREDSQKNRRSGKEVKIGLKKGRAIGLDKQKSNLGHKNDRH